MTSAAFDLGNESVPVGKLRGPLFLVAHSIDRMTIHRNECCGGSAAGMSGALSGAPFRAAVRVSASSHAAHRASGDAERLRPFHRIRKHGERAERSTRKEESPGSRTRRDPGRTGGEPWAQPTRIQPLEQALPNAGFSRPITLSVLPQTLTGT